MVKMAGYVCFKSAAASSDYQTLEMKMIAHPTE
jgi:hypothetical protein